MKYLPILFFSLHFFSVLAQTPQPDELYEKIKTYYTQNVLSVEFVENTHRNALGYDTTRGSFIYIPYQKNNFMLAWSDSEYSINGPFISDGNYVLPNNRPEKIKVKRKELSGTIYDHLSYIPSYNRYDLKKAFGKIKGIFKDADGYTLFTSKYVMKVDTSSFRIKSFIWIVMFEGRMQYNHYKFILIPDSIQLLLKRQATDLAEASKDFPTTTFNKIIKKKIPVTNAEGQPFSFTNLISFNKGPLDSVMKNKYVIFDFFYQTCYPCHQMTKWILEWMPTVDTSKLILIGIDPADKEESMKAFVKDRGINYPVIIGQQAKDIARYYHISGYPTLFLLSPDGRIQTIHEGMSKKFLKKAEKIVAR